ncbi:hydroxymyristoyl-ACP dehydratase [Roseicella frigidaeris]|uniref:Hydroxymyristoyl-ACP dehydratase n=1 Tax=Roseicella frigidaeris TaxID=2230885 RepID=A0A327MDP4_9PROT|nr:hydroxymyristoyl-ACP dehydratase [Roseicella frigidaeris]RAI58308.1 hydroxymyristoyl-ACP dehydratase [Roseicella frigidaeris]
MLSPPLDAAAIARLVPHAGAMCLLDRALAWDAVRIRCETGRHAAPANPLRRDGRLPAVCGVEFALQAMALHGALTGGALNGGEAPPRAGFLSSLRELTLAAARLDDIPGPLAVTAEALAAETRGCIYRFEVAAGATVLLAGQAAVMLPEAAP